ncbi:hypothetical protein F4802DRAFT_569223 [Xylaria palmicola]|nr:hypothetical protein F4802DRAFT_569223 [Xylaria palmicola]
MPVLHDTILARSALLGLCLPIIQPLAIKPTSVGDWLNLQCAAKVFYIQERTASLCRTRLFSSSMGLSVLELTNTFLRGNANRDVVIEYLFPFAFRIEETKDTIAQTINSYLKRKKPC